MSSAQSPPESPSPVAASLSHGNETLNRPPASGGSRGIRLWLVFASLMMATFVSALDVTAGSTALPTILNKLNGSEFVWVGSAYSLGSTAFLPASGGMAQIFGRKPVIVVSLLFFLLGSGLCGGASSMSMLIAGRTVQGIGSGGILSLTEIIIADLVPLSERGTYMGIIGAVWAVASAAGPPIGGALAQNAWRWLFYLNVPLTAFATVLVVVFLNVKAPTENLETKLGRIDWTGNVLVIAAATSTIIALSWGGVKYDWDSPRVLVPLVLGLAGLVFFLWYERKFAKEPVVPWELFSSPTSLSGFLGTFFNGVIVTGVTYYVPAYFQAAKVQPPVSSGVSFLASAITICIAAMVAGVTVTSFKCYRPQNIAGWALCCLGTGLLTLLHADATKATYICVQIPIGVGLGIIFTVTTFPILAPVPLNRIAHAIAQMAFLREFAFTWGTTIGSTVLQNQLRKKLPSSFLAQFDTHAEIAFVIIPTIKELPDPLQTQVRAAFADSLTTLWWLLLGISAVGLATTAMMKEIPMQEITDDQFGMTDEKRKRQEVSEAEKGVRSY